MAYDYVIIGGGIAGVTAAETIRGRDHEGSIALISAESHPLYSRVMLPSYARGTLNREQVFLRSIADYEKNGIKLFLGSEAVGLNCERREVHTNSGTIFSYKTLLISTGGAPARWRVEGLPADQAGGDHPLVYRLQTLEDADRLRETLRQSSGQDALVIGCGFIGLEFIESFITHGVRPIVIMPEAYAFERFMGPDGGRLLEDKWKRAGAEIARRTSVEALRPSKNGLPAGQVGVVALTTEGQGYHGAFAGVGIGLERNISVFTGIGLDVKGGIVTNEFLETNNPGVFAAGDVAEYFDLIFQKHRLAGNWTNAYLQGSVAGENMVRFLRDEQTAYRPFRKVSSYSFTHMGTHLAFLGECDAEDAQANEEFLPRDNAYTRMLFREKKLVGASLINRPKDIAYISARIEESA